MNCLLDSCAFLWTFFQSKKLSARARDAILHPDNEVFISTVTFWELSLKFSLGKLSLKNVLPDELPFISTRSGFKIFTPSADDLSSFYRLPRKGLKDPFDRLLVWLAIKNDFTLISADTSFTAYGENGLRVLW